MPKFHHTIESINDFEQLLIIGDVHGNLEQFDRAVSYANTHDMFIISLGDVIDYGPNAKECVLLAHDLVGQNKLIMVCGNHEVKAFKYFTQVKEGNVRVKVKQALQASIDSFGNDDNIIEKFMNLYSTTANIIRYKNTFFTHGALDYKVINNPSYSPYAYQLSLFGEVDNTLPSREDGFPNRVFHWVKKIPDDITVMVGHDIRSFDEPVVDNNVYFMDTGMSKKERNVENPKQGFLSGAVLDKNGQFINFVRFDR